MEEDDQNGGKSPPTGCNVAMTPPGLSTSQATNSAR